MIMPKYSPSGSYEYRRLLGRAGEGGFIAVMPGDLGRESDDQAGTRQASGVCYLVHKAFPNGHCIGVLFRETVL